MSYSIDDPTSVVLTLTNASTLLSNVIDTLTCTKRSKKGNANMLTRTVGRAINRKRLSLPIPECPSSAVTETVRREADAILSHVRRAKGAISSHALYDKVMAAGCFDEQYERSRPQVLSFFDMLFCFC